jgi:hypothetical protein
MAEFLRSPKPILQYLIDRLNDWRGWPTLYANFHLIRLRFFASVPVESLPGYDLAEEERHISGLLKSKQPSRFLSGLRQLHAAQTFSTDLRLIPVMLTLSRIIMKKFTLFQSVHWALGTKIQVINAWLIQPVYQSFHQTICDRLMFTLTTSPAVPYFFDYLAWVPTAIRSGVISSHVVEDLELFSSVRSPSTFNLVLAILKELIAANPGRAHDIAIDSCLSFLTNHSGRQSYYTIVYLRKIVAVLAGIHRDALFHFSASALKTVNFLAAFLAVCDIVKTVKNAEYTAFLIGALVEMTRAEGHRRALARIANGPLTREILEIAATAE